jgi:hypothetical protein
LGIPKITQHFYKCIYNLKKGLRIYASVCLFHIFTSNNHIWHKPKNQYRTNILSIITKCCSFKLPQMSLMQRNGCSAPKRRNCVFCIKRAVVSLKEQRNFSYVIFLLTNIKTKLNETHSNINCHDSYDKLNRKSPETR